MSTLGQLLEARSAEFRAVMRKSRIMRLPHLRKVCKRLNGRQGKTYRRMFWLHSE